MYVIEYKKVTTVKSTMKYSAGILFLIIIGLAGTVYAERVYVSELMKITMRTGPGVSHKIIAMVASGDSLEIIERGSDWSRVRKSDGKEGWVLSRFITNKVPVILTVEKLRQKNTELSELLEKTRTEKEALSGTREKLETLEKEYNALKNKSANFLATEKKYNEAVKKMAEQENRISVLESQLNNEDIRWFLSGAGVLILGIIFGMSARKQRKSSLL